MGRLQLERHNHLLLLTQTLNPQLHHITFLDIKRTGSLHENNRLFWDWHASFKSMVGVVKANGDKFGRTHHRAPQAGRAQDPRQAGGFDFAQSGQGCVTELGGVNVLDVLAQVTQIAISIYQARLFFARVAITNEFP